ncbi:MAG: hypothetical protein NZL90_00515 [Aquificaceae bacterium]|nr:hypothetical protein [Aquificaceae bacterium]MDW8237027.1 hypothetical protein [Aquificaceae bacterium]
MPIQEEFLKEVSSKLKKLAESFIPYLTQELKKVDEEDIEMGFGITLRLEDLLRPWQEAIEDANYFSILQTEVFEHHDGIYLKATFANSCEEYIAKRHISIRSNGRVEISHELFININRVSARIERKDNLFSVFFRSL